MFSNSSEELIFPLFCKTKFIEGIKNYIYIYILFQECGTSIISLFVFFTYIFLLNQKDHSSITMNHQYLETYKELMQELLLDTEII